MDMSWLMKDPMKDRTSSTIDILLKYEKYFGRLVLINWDTFLYNTEGVMFNLSAWNLMHECFDIIILTSHDN